MTTAPQIITRRERRRAAAQRNIFGKLGLGCALLVSLLIVLVGCLSAFTYINLTKNLPSLEILPTLFEPPDGQLLQPTRLYDHTGEHVLLVLQNPVAADRQYLAITNGGDPQSAIPEGLITATLATTDPHFWEHGGAPLTSFVLGARSTIAKRLAVDYLLANEVPGLRRSLRAHILGAQLISRYGRQKILEWYLNSADYGRLAYGADAAARVYFGKPASELSLSEAAMLAATAETPEHNPIDSPRAAFESQISTIQRMLQYRMISPEDGIQAARAPLALRDPESKGMPLSISDLDPTIALAFSRLALSQLESQISRDELERGGYQIVTTLDYDLQTAMDCLARIQHARLSSSNELSTDEELVCDAALLLPTINNEDATFATDLQTEIMVLDPKSGQILALVGNPPLDPTPAAMISHPSGSLITPFIYLTAFTRGMNPGSLVWDVPAVAASGQIQNFNGNHHGPMRLRIAMANDYLVPAEQVLKKVGANNVRHTLSQFAMSISTSSEESANVLDLMEQVDLLSVVQAFGIFANKGVLVGQSLNLNETSESPADISHLHPNTILKVFDPDGEIIVERNNPQRRPIITSQLAYLMTDVLSDEPARWPSLGHPNPLEIGRHTAAKLSRTPAGDSHWSIGYSPQLAIGVWMGIGDQDPPRMEDINPAILQNATAGLWHAASRYAHQDMPYETWEPPGGLTLIEVCDPSGDLPTRDCPNTVTEIFLSGNEPAQSDTLYRTLAINRDNGRLATVFTASERVEERIYMMIPPHAADWAKATGMEIPPQLYETIPSNPYENDDVVIQKPANFDLVRGRVDIYGIARGNDFDFYQLQVGKGLFPQEWLQISDQVSEATTGQLASWDTDELNGLYSIQLLLVRKNQSLERVNVLVTVDNTPPEVHIVAPLNGTTVEYSPSREIILSVHADDDFGIHSVAFYLNDEPLDIRLWPPYAVSWKLEQGEHNLRIIATDQAGNTSGDFVRFVVE